jgi:hypothetical protein
MRLGLHSYGIAFRFFAYVPMSYSFSLRFSLSIHTRVFFISGACLIVFSVLSVEASVELLPLEVFLVAFALLSVERASVAVLVAFALLSVERASVAVLVAFAFSLAPVSAADFPCQSKIHLLSTGVLACSKFVLHRSGSMFHFK